MPFSSWSFITLTALLLFLTACAAPTPSPTPTPTAPPPTPTLTATPIPTVAPTPTPNLVTLHLEATTITAQECIACHGSRTEETSLDEEVAPPHVVHLTSPFLSITCTDCHSSIDLREGSAAGLRRQVDVDLCAQCHSPFPETMDISFKDTDCTTCHGDWQERMDSPLVDESAVTSEDCLLCHGGQPWYESR
ncbi:MAG: cytochrome c3 family protein [Anaerolineae bacterium]